MCERVYVCLSQRVQKVGQKYLKSAGSECRLSEGAFEYLNAVGSTILGATATPVH